MIVNKVNTSNPSSGETKDSDIDDEYYLTKVSSDVGALHNCSHDLHSIYCHSRYWSVVKIIFISRG